MWLLTLAERKGWELNPVFVFEARRFWGNRRGRRIALGCGGLTIVALGFGWVYYWVITTKAPVILVGDLYLFAFYAINSALPIWSPYRMFRSSIVVLSDQLLQFLTIIVNFLIPPLASLSVAEDRENGRMNQLRITGIQPSKIIWGKTAAILMPLLIPAAFVFLITHTVDYFWVHEQIEARSEQGRGLSPGMTRYFQWKVIWYPLWTLGTFVQAFAVTFISIWAGLKSKQVWRAVGLAFTIVVSSRFLGNLVLDWTQRFPRNTTTIANLALQFLWAFVFYLLCRNRLKRES